MHARYVCLADDGLPVRNASWPRLQVACIHLLSVVLGVFKFHVLVQGSLRAIGLRAPVHLAHKVALDLSCSAPVSLPLVSHWVLHLATVTHLSILVAGLLAGVEGTVSILGALVVVISVHFWIVLFLLGVVNRGDSPIIRHLIRIHQVRQATQLLTILSMSSLLGRSGLSLVLRPIYLVEALLKLLALPNKLLETIDKYKIDIICLAVVNVVLIRLQAGLFVVLEWVHVDRLVLLKTIKQGHIDCLEIVRH